MRNAVGLNLACPYASRTTRIIRGRPSRASLDELGRAVMPMQWNPVGENAVVSFRAPQCLHDNQRVEGSLKVAALARIGEDGNGDGAAVDEPSMLKP